jgi:N-acetylmuramoyl-L-alanine amidase
MTKKQIIAGLLCLLAMIVLLVNLLTAAFPQYAAVFFSQGKTVKEVVLKYDNAPSQGKIQILLVPGHEPDYGGAEYGSIIERDLNVALAQRLEAYLSTNDKFEVVVSRDFNKWNTDLDNYFTNNLAAIQDWRNEQKKEMTTLVNEGRINLIDSVQHNSAPTLVATHLYGINKWANENKIDITLHIHFNDNPKINGRPNFSGFAIYVPEKQYSNSTSSIELANDLLSGLSTVSGVSTMPQESAGVVQDQDLIAIGRFNTSDTLSALIEYAYIYEGKLRTKEMRRVFMDKMAEATAKALTNFFEKKATVFSLTS